MAEAKTGEAETRPEPTEAADNAEIGEEVEEIGAKDSREDLPEVQDTPPILQNLAVIDITDMGQMLNTVGPPSHAPGSQRCQPSHEGQASLVKIKLKELKMTRCSQA